MSYATSGCLLVFALPMMIGVAALYSLVLAAAFILLGTAIVVIPITMAALDHLRKVQFDQENEVM